VGATNIPNGSSSTAELTTRAVEVCAKDPLPAALPHGSAGVTAVGFESKTPPKASPPSKAGGGAPLAKILLKEASFEFI
jgi:hypothetical protein